MNIYFIRHGETVGNKSKIHQSPVTPLSRYGKQQAQILGRRLRSIKITRAYCSWLLRAKQTAKIVQQYHPISFKYLKIFNEWTWPSIIRGKHQDDKEVARIKRFIDNRRLQNPDFQHSDEESVNMLIKRLDDIKQFLEKQPGDQSILIITHGFLNIYE